MTSESILITKLYPTKRRVHLIVEAVVTESQHKGALTNTGVAYKDNFVWSILWCLLQ